MEEKKLGLKSVISVSVGLVIATSCLVSLGQGAGTDRDIILLPKMKMEMISWYTMHAQKQR